MKIIIGKLYSLLKYFCHFLFKTNRYEMTVSAINYLKSEQCSLPQKDKKEIRDFLSKHIICQISYNYIYNYTYNRVKVLVDKKNKLPYVLHKSKRLYFKKSMSNKEIQNLYNALCIEQDERSPHYYPPPYYKDHSVVAVDAGAAEGIWGLSIIENIDQLYLFECDRGWIEALEATFFPWKEKVCIVNKYLSSKTTGEEISLDDYFFDKKIYPSLIKADIEGAENELIEGATSLIRNGHIHDFIICTYHNEDDFDVLSGMLEGFGYITSASEGYMITIYSNPNYTYSSIHSLFRKGIIHAYK